MTRSLFSTACVLVLALSLLACGDPDENNGGSNIVPPINNSSSANNTTPNNVTTGNNTTPGNNTTTGNNTSTAPDCVALNPALEGECDVLCQSGCMAGQGCSIMEQPQEPGMEGVVVWTSSCAAGGTGGQGDSCTVNEDCQPGYGCVEPRDGGATVCQQYCRAGGPEAPRCPMNLVCQGFQTEIRVGTCQEPMQGCTVFPESCGDGEQCYESPTDGSAECVTQGEIGRYEPCENPGECQEGLRCYSPSGGESICVKICDPSDDEPDLDCRENETCTDVPGGVSWGACIRN